MLPSMVSYNSTGGQIQDMEEDFSALGAELDEQELDDSSTEFDFNPADLLRSPLFDNSDDELERIPSSGELNYNYVEEQDAFPSHVAFDQQSNHVAPSPSSAHREQKPMYLDANGFPVSQKVNKRRAIPEEHRPRRIPGLVKQGSSRSSLLSRRSVETPLNANSGMAFHNYDNMPMDRFSSMDVNMNTSPHDMDVTMSSPEPEGIHVPGDLRSYNDAMEKLCESMKRSAMSRNLIKQLSGQSLQKDSSSRNIGSGTQATHPSTSRPSSGRSLNVVSRQSSAHSLVKQSSGRGLVPQGSVRSLDDNGLATLSAGVYPSSRHRHSMEAKHRMSRGVFRHKSSNAVMDNSRPRNSNMHQHDDSSLGLVFDGKNMYS